MHLENTPLYEQVKGFVRTKIKNGKWVAGDSVPSESALMHQFGVSRMTINRALRELMAAGVVRRVQGSGTFVAEIDHVSSKLEIRDIQEEIEERGHVVCGFFQNNPNPALAGCGACHQCCLFD